MLQQPRHGVVLRRLKCLDSKKKKLPRKDLEGTLWGTPPARPLGVAAPPTVDVSKRREPPALTKRLEKVEVLGGRGPKKQAAQPKGSTKAKKVAEKARARDTGGRDWTFDRRKKTWIVCAADAADFTLDHEAVGDDVRCDVHGEALDGEVLGVAEGPPWRCRIRYENGLQENLDEKQLGMARRAHTTWQNKLAKGAKPPRAAPKRKAPAKPAAKRRKPRYEDDDDEAFTASAPARTGTGGRRSARATAAARGSLREASDDEDFELVDVDEPAPAPPPPPPKRARTAPQQEFKKGDRVDAKFGRWYRATVDEVIRDAAGKITKYEIKWSNGDSNPIARGNVREPVAGTELG